MFIMKIPHQIWTTDSLVGLMMLVPTMVMVMMLLLLMMLLMIMMMLLMLMPLILLMMMMLMPLMPMLMITLPTTLSQSFASSHPVDCPQSPSNLQFTCHKSHFSSSNVCNFHLSHFICHSSAVTSHKSKSQVTNQSHKSHVTILQQIFPKNSPKHDWLCQAYWKQLQRTPH